MGSTIPNRTEINISDTWDLSGLFANGQQWEDSFIVFDQAVEKLGMYKGSLADSSDILGDALKAKFSFEQLADRLGEYAGLTLAQDVGDGPAQDRMARFTSAAAKAEAATAYFEPEILAIPNETLNVYLSEPSISEYTIYLKKLIRMKPHVLTEAEERILGLQAEPAQATEKAFSALLNSDLDFGMVETPDGPRPLTQSSLVSFLQKPERDLRERAFTQFYDVLDSHKQTLSALLAGSVQQDTFMAKVRGFGSAREKALFPDKVPTDVYDNLIDSVRANLHHLHHFYRLRAKALGIDRLKHFDSYVSVAGDVSVRHDYIQAVDKIIPSLAPLGSEYCDVLEAGLKGRWVDRYENKGKRSGAFSAGTFESDPFILMNFDAENIRDVFTLAHEGGHSMHSWYAKKNNPYPHYNYSIFEAEVASTFNENLLVRYLLDHVDDTNLRKYLVANKIQDMVGTIFRQTMFAEFEKSTHEMLETGEALTLDTMRTVYRGLLETYFGPDVELQQHSDLEFSRIPHFYWAFYVYKYATGLSASISLSRMVLEGGSGERERYLNFLKAGGSKYPLDNLRDAGVDMTTAEPVNIAMKHFGDLVKSLEEMI